MRSVFRFLRTFIKVGPRSLKNIPRFCCFDVALLVYSCVSPRCTLRAPVIIVQNRKSRFVRVDMTIIGLCFWRSTMRAKAPAVFSRGQGTYTQGQSPEPHIREYFYYLDHQGQLFLDDTKVKNFVTCFKDQQFLVFFFKHLKVNRSGRYQQQFPFLSLCGRERNFLCCDDKPVVFTHLASETGQQAHLSYCGGGTKLTFPFQPHSLFMHPDSGRVYHPAPEVVGGVGLVRSALAIEFSPHFHYSPGQDSSAQPTHFLWAGQRYTLTNELLRHFTLK